LSGKTPDFISGFGDDKIGMSDICVPYHTCS